MRTTDLEGPLSQFQGVEANEEGMMSLILSLNQVLPDKDKMTDEMVRNTFRVWWPDLEKRIAEIPTHTPVNAMKPARSERQLLEEILEISRRLGGTSELKQLPTVSDMVAALVTQREMLDRRESGIQAAEVAAERGGLDDSHPHLVSIREAMSNTWDEQKIYDDAISALTAIENWHPKHN